jgi:hypothetical protein
MITASPALKMVRLGVTERPAVYLLDIAQAWRRLDGAHLLPLVGADILFVDGVQQ